MQMDSFRVMSCTRNFALVSGDIVDVSLIWGEGARFSQGQLARLQLAFTTTRAFSGLGAVIRIFDQAGRCAFAKHFVDLDVSTICRFLEPGRHVMVVQFVAALPAGWYALTFSLAENLSGNFADPEAWRTVCEQSCYAPFYVGAALASNGEGYCCLPFHAHLAPPGSQDAIVGNDDSFPEFPWGSDQPLYSVAQVVAALHELVPSGAGGNGDLPHDWVLSPGCAAMIFPANHPRLHTQVGQRTEHGIVTTREAGALLFGPYMLARPGQYTVTFFGSYRLPSALPVVVDVVAAQGTMILGRKELPVVEGEADGKISFVVPDPGVRDLEFRVFVEPDSEFEIRQIEIVSAAGDNPLRTVLRSILRWAFPIREAVVLVLVPGVNWLHFVLSITEEIYRRYSKRSVLVVLQDHPVFDEAEKLTASVLGAISLRELSKTTFEAVYAVVSHDFAWGEQSNQLLQRYPGALHWVYADGFRGELCDPVRHAPKAELAFFFGHVSSNPNGVPEICIPAFELVKQVKSIARVCPAFNPGAAVSGEPNNLAVIYLRYWGIGAYAMSTDQVVASILATMEAVLLDDVCVVIKNDPRVSADVLAALLDRLSQEKWLWLMLEEHLESIGIDRKYASLDAPYLFSKGILVSAKYHFVFDSSVAFYLAEQAPRREDIQIVFGAINPAWDDYLDLVIDGRYIDYILRCDSGVSENSARGGVGIIRHYADLFSSSLCNVYENVRINKISPICFVGSFDKVLD